MPPGVFRRAPRIHNPFQLLTTIFVQYGVKGLWNLLNYFCFIMILIRGQTH